MPSVSEYKLTVESCWSTKGRGNVRAHKIFPHNKNPAHAKVVLLLLLGYNIHARLIS
jgi:hypothetical protein